jgi:pyridoxal phosphate enzyme (YggS family)
MTWTSPTSSNSPIFPSLEERLAGVRQSVADSARDAGRDASKITTIVVTKFHPPSLVRELFRLGATDFGENRHQEAAEKAAELADIDANWHFIGQLQSNKAAAVARYARVIHSVDRASLIAPLSGGAGLDVFIQLNLTEDRNRGGLDISELENLAEKLIDAEGIHLLGLMAVAPIDTEPRLAFATVRLASERLQRIAPQATALSMGMSGDYREAILEGATHLRIGTAITGNRPSAG